MSKIYILLVYDVNDWACHTECKAIKLHLDLQAPGKFEIVLARAGSTPSLSKFDIVFSTIYYHLQEAEHHRSISQISSYSYWIRKGWPDGWPHLTRWRYMVAKNSHIHELLQPDDHPRITKLYHPLDHRHWQQQRPTHADPGYFTLGFAGHKQDLKGLQLIESTIKDLSGVRLLTPTWEENRIPQDAMPGFYSSLDAYVCMSQFGHDAGPRPPMEAALCGVPVITTRVGQIGEMIENEVNGLVVERSTESLREAILRLQNDSHLQQKLAGNARLSIMTDWVHGVGKTWTDYFLEIAEGGLS